MRILLAPDKFKGSLSASEVARAMHSGIARVDPTIEVDECPIADGGEGTVEAIVRARNGRFETHRVTGPLPEMKVDARFGIIEAPIATQRRSASAAADSSTTVKTAVIEMSAASGLALLKPTDRDPLATTTFGTGELINRAIKLGCRRILIGLGGSATIDGGIGAAQACGLPVLLEGGEPTRDTEPLCGRDLPSVVLIKHGRGDRIGGVEIVGLCDVDNPLFGPLGAARTFGSQKGATTESIQQLDRDLQQLATRNGKLDIASQPGAGAAGGLGFGLAAFFGATLERGAEHVLEALRFQDRLASADLCLTGEGRIDASTQHGKAPAVVARLCRAANRPCIAIAGSVDRSNDFDRAVAICDEATSEADSMARASELIANVTERIVRDFITTRTSS